MKLFNKIVNECTPEYLRAPINQARVKPTVFEKVMFLNRLTSVTINLPVVFILSLSGSGII